MELYHERLAMGKRKADLYFVLDVIMLFRPGIIRPSDPYPSNSNAMFKSYFTIAGRNLLRNKGYSAINIGGLAAGMTISMLIVLWMWDELTFDSYHENRSRIVRVMQHQTVDGKVASQFAVPMPLEAAIRNTFSDDFTHISLVSWVGGHILSTEEKNISQLGTFVQASFPEIISLRMVSGPKDAMHDPSAIILSASAATALFGAKDPINQTVRIDDTMDFKVTGVYEDLPVSSSFHDAAFLASWDVYTASYDWLKRSAHQWDNNSFQLFALLAPGADVDAVSEKIKMVRADNAGPERFKPEVFLHPMSDWHLRSEWKNGVKTGGSIQMVWLFGTIGVFVLLLACINFMNLSTARSEKRAKEVGIRMSIGSRRSQLINQFLTESFFVVSIAFLISILLVLLSLPWFNLLAGKQISIPWSNPMVWAACLAFVMITSLVAGSYPALFLSSFRPVKVLKGTFKAGRLSSVPRKTLVVLQFTVSVALVIGTILVYQQIEFTKNRPVGFEPEGLIMIQMRSPEFYGKYDVLREAFNKSGGVDEMSMSSSPLTGIWQNSGGFRWQGKDPNSQSADFGTIWITPEYGKTVNWSIKKGRDFSRDFGTDSTAAILNQAAVDFINVPDPMGMEIKWRDKTFRVIGIVNDMVVESPYRPVRQNIYLMNSEHANWINIRLNPSRSMSESLALIEKVYKQHITSAPFDYQFVNDVYRKKFDAEERIGKLAYVFSALAVMISCLGLVGLASYVAEQRIKEIGIRKIHGASVVQLWSMLSGDFLVLVVMACVMAIPLSYFYMADWLQKYPYHVGISWTVFALAGAGALLVTLATVSYQAVKAAVLNPVKALRSE